MKSKKAILLTLGLAIGLIFSAAPANAADFRFATKGDGDIFISADETVKNLYTVGGNVTINGNIEKDLHAAGGSVLVNGNVSGMLCIGGGTVIIKGNIGGSAHIGGGNVVIDGKITDDLFIGGGNVTISDSASIGGDLIVGAGNIVINGPVEGRLIVGAGQVTINNRIGGDIKAEVDNITLGPNAVLAGKFEYTAPKEATVTEGAQILGVTDYQAAKAKKSAFKKGSGAFAGFLAIGLLIKLLAMIATGLVFVYLLKSITKPVVKESFGNFWASLGIGFAALILTPIVAILLLFTLIGVPLAFLLGMIYIILMLMSMTLAAISIGSLIVKLIKKQKEYTIGWLEVLLGTVAVSILNFIPLLGWLVILVFFLLSLGALYQFAHKSILAKK